MKPNLVWCYFKFMESENTTEFDDDQKPLWTIGSLNYNVISELKAVQDMSDMENMTLLMWSTEWWFCSIDEWINIL